MQTNAQKAADDQQADPLYTCAECGEPVIIFNGKSFRTCDHIESAVNANMQAVVRGIGGVQ